jgi:hypothetical protein
MAALLINSAADLGHTFGDGLNTKTKWLLVVVLLLVVLFHCGSTLRRRHPSYIFGVRITVSFFSELLGTLHELPQSMRMLMIVTTIN